jgi:hypothetical protein
MSAEFAQAPNHDLLVRAMQTADSEQEEIVMLLQVRKADLDRQYQERMFTASQPWNRLAATEDQQAQPAGLVKEVTVPQTGQTAQHQRSALPLAPQLTFLLRHIQKTHKENAGGDRQAPTEVSRIQMVNDI